VHRDRRRVYSVPVDTLIVQVDPGPYMGYQNSGNVKGNITTRS
jgi:hypothetical protein